MKSLFIFDCIAFAKDGKQLNWSEGDFNSSRCFFTITFEIHIYIVLSNWSVRLSSAAERC